MKKFTYCPIIQVGDIFSRVDKNGKRWKAKVIDRTEYFVDIEKTQPYQIKVADEGIAGQYGCWHYEDAKPTIERCMIYRKYVEVEDGQVEEQGLYGPYMKTLYKKVPTAEYYIEVKETYSAHSEYDRTYKLIKYGDGVEQREDDLIGIQKWFNYCENEDDTIFNKND